MAIQIYKLCEQCGQSFSPKASGIVKQQSRKFCSQKCNGNSKIKDLESKFWEKVNKSGKNDCWMWTATKLPRGYGTFGEPTGKGKQIYAHRYSYELHFGNIEKGLYVCHKCDNPSCVNPAHLFLGTPKDNAQDMFNKKRENQPKGEKHALAKLTDEKVRELRKFHSQGFSFRELSRQFNVDYRSARSAILGITWKHVK